MNRDTAVEAVPPPPAPSGTTMRAITEYGSSLTDPKYLVFARMLSEGKTQISAYDSCFPHTAGSTIETRRNQASILAAHPDMPGLMDAHALGGQTLLAALVPTSIRTLAGIIKGEVKDGAKVRLDAIKTTLSRAGLPESKELAVSGIMLAVSAHARLAPLQGTVAAGEAISQKHDNRAALELSRDKWKVLEPAD